MDLPEHLQVNGKGLPVKLFLLRFRWFRHGEARREPAYRFYTLYEAIPAPAVQGRFASNVVSGGCT